MVFRRPKLGRLLARLRDGDEAVRFAALDELAQLDVERLSERELAELLEAAAVAYPPHRFDFVDIPTDLVRAAARRPVEQHVAIAERLYGGLSDGARQAVLMLLATLNTRSSLTTFVRLLRAHGAPATPMPLGGPGLTDEPAHGDILFPALLEIAADGDLLADALEVALAYERAGALPADGARAACDAVQRVWPRLRTAVLDAARPDERAWFWAEDYYDTRRLAGIALDVAGRSAQTSSMRCCSTRRRCQTRGWRCSRSPGHCGTAWRPTPQRWPTG